MGAHGPKDKGAAASGAKGLSPRRSVPAVEKLLHRLGETGMPRAVVVAMARRTQAALRRRAQVPEFEAVVAEVRGALAALRRARLQPVINGTGVVIHTNLGRAPLGSAVIEGLVSAAAHYTNLEYDLATGARGGRAAYLEHQLALLCGAEAATVANNCAAALVLILRHFTAGPRKEVIISRGELAQIGGGFRIPDILETSGAILHEVGATNRTSLNDYARAAGRHTALILKVHRSNFFMGGFVESPSTAELAGLARRRRLPLVEDLGSGAVIETSGLAGLEHEPTPAEVLRQGVDVVCFSGDKLLGGPQAGVIAGKARHVAGVKREPFFRALRCDKLILTALQATVDLYLERGGDGVPVIELLRLDLEPLRARAQALMAGLAGLPVQASVAESQAQVGGGTLPRSTMASVALDLAPLALEAAAFAERLRLGTPPVIALVSHGRVRVDLRTVFASQDGVLLAALRRALTGGPAPA